MHECPTIAPTNMHKAFEKQSHIRRESLGQHHTIIHNHGSLRTILFPCVADRAIKVASQSESEKQRRKKDLNGGIRQHVITDCC